MKVKYEQGIAITAAMLLFPAWASACATCGCSLSTDAANGYSATTGWRVSIDYSYIDQNQLRTGSNAVSASKIAQINDAGGNQEVEHGTINRYTTLGLAYAGSPNWNFRLLVPYIDRVHTTYGESSNPLTPDLISGATATGIGDVKLIANYQGLLPTHNFGLQFGVKLPTGNYGGPNANGTGIVGRNPVAFSTGPNSLVASPGNLLDTSLNPGTGSTDLIAGAYYFQPISQDFDAFVNGQFQSAVSEKLNQPGADYRPGNQITISFGLRYEADPKLVPQLQLNLSRKSGDQGALADLNDTAGIVAYLSPGVTFNAGHGLIAYGFLQMPVYSKLDGYQLFPRWTASTGLSYAF